MRNCGYSTSSTVASEEGAESGVTGRWIQVFYIFPNKTRKQINSNIPHSGFLTRVKYTADLNMFNYVSWGHMVEEWLVIKPFYKNMTGLNTAVHMLLIIIIRLE